MAILNKKREMEYTMKLKENELVVYTATPEQINKMLKGGNNMGRPKGSKNKTNHSGIELNKVEWYQNKTQKKSGKAQAIKDMIMEEAEARKNKVEIEVICDVEKLPEEVIKANPILIDKADHELLKGAVEAIGPRLPIIEHVATPKKEAKSDFRGKLLSNIRRATLSICIEEIAGYVTDIKPENMNEKLIGIRDTINVALDELELLEI